jgi:hypothetical protein
MAWLTGWSKRLALTVDSSNVDSTLTDFPVMLKLSTSSGIGDVDVAFVFQELGSDANRKKIAVTSVDGTTELYVEIEKWNHANGLAWLHVKVPSVSSSADTGLYLYYDSAHVDNDSYVGDTTDAVVHNVWDSTFKAVWHMAQDPNGDGADAIKESTSNASDLTPGGSMTTADLLEVETGGALQFDGSDDYLHTDGNDTNFNLGADDFCIEFLVNWPVMPTTSTWKDFAAFGSPADERRSFIIDFYQQSSTWQFFRMHTFSDGYAATQISSQASLGAVTLAVDTDYVYALRRVSGTIYFYLNGALMGSSASIGAQSIYENTADPLTIASWHGTWDFLAGIMSEARFSGSRSADWVSATYTNLSDSLITFGAVEEDFGIISAEPLTAIFSLSSSGATTDEPIAVEPFQVVSSLSGDVILIQRTLFNSTIDVINSIKVGSTIDIVNSLNAQITSNIDLVLSVLQSIEATFGIKLTIDDLVKFNDTETLVNHILDADSGITQGQYYFKKSHGL